jgi:regulatory protein
VGLTVVHVDQPAALSGRASITALEPDPARPETVHVWVDGRRFCTVPVEALQDAGLTVGSAVDRAAEAELGHAADREAAFRTALRALERRAFSTNDLARRLVRKSHPPEAVDQAIERLCAVGLLDDARYAAQFVAVYSARGRGPVRLRADLRRRGVASDVIDRALAEQFPPGTDLKAQTVALARKRAAQLGDLSHGVKRRRLLAYLARRGFRGSEVLEAVDEVLMRPASGSDS